MRILICDDDACDALKIKENTERYFGNKKVDISICTPEDVMIQLEEDFFNYDIAIMDIFYEGCKFDGIEVTNLINEKAIACRVIYISSILEFAPEVYETKHVYFVLKKNMSVTLKLALEKAIKSIDSEVSSQIIELVSENKKYHIRVDDILYIERFQRLVKYVTAQKEYPTYDTIGKAAENIPTIVRCQGSYKVNLDHIKSMTRETITVSNDTVIPIGRTYYEKFRQKYFKYFESKI